MPPLDCGSNLQSTDNKIDTDGLIELCAVLAAFEPVACVIEAVHGYGGQNAAASFVFGQVYGELRAALRAAGVPLVPVPPSVWKPALGVPANKTAALARAAALMPASATNWTRSTVDDGPGEAALLAYYGAHVLGLDGCPATIGGRRPRVAFSKRLPAGDKISGRS